MRIIEHGKFYEQGNIVCKNCNCHFVYTLDDIMGHHAYEDNKEFQVTEVSCPECNLIIEINRELIENNTINDNQIDENTTDLNDDNQVDENTTDLNDDNQVDENTTDLNDDNN